jgi:hypothetical protein
MTKKIKKAKIIKSLIIPDCVPLDSSEVLTRNGWKPIQELVAGEEIATSDTEFNMKFDTPSAIHIQEPREVYAFTRGSVLFESTEGHRNAVINGNKNLVMRTTGSLLGKRCSLKSNGMLTEGETIDRTLAILIGFCIGDGTRDTHNWKINIKKQRKIDYLDALFTDEMLTKHGPDKLGMTQYRIRADFTRFVDQFVGSKNKQINFEAFLKLSAVSMEHVIEGIIESDGARKSDRPNVSVYSVRSDNIALVQTLCHLTGKNAILQKPMSNAHSTFPSDRPLLGVCIQSNDSGIFTGSYVATPSRIVEVGCVTVPSGMFLIRQHGNISITGNCHIPFHDERAYNLCLETGYQADVDEIVILGDFVDFYAVNAHGKRPGLSDLLQYEIDSGRNALAELRSMFPEAKIVFLIGNHCHRLERFISSRAPELYGLLDIKSLLGFDKLNITSIPYGPNQMYKVGGGKLLARHEPLGGGVHSAHSTAVKAGHSVIYGHVHRIQESQIVFIDGANHRGITCGWLGDQNHEVMQYVKNHHQWALGFAIVHTLPNGNFFCDLKHIIDYKVLHEGEIIEG